MVTRYRLDRHYTYSSKKCSGEESAEMELVATNRLRYPRLFAGFITSAVIICAF